MVRVIAYGSNADNAIAKAKLDAVAAASFFGIPGEDQMDSIPAILFDAKGQYIRNKKELDLFFRNGNYLSFVTNANSTYPSGHHNIQTPKGRKVEVTLIIDWQALSNFYSQLGLKTIMSSLSE